jgi:hypothetical protein
MKALEVLPEKIPSSLNDVITRCMTDSNLGVQNYAFLAALRMELPAHRDIALAVLKSEDDEWLQRSAIEIALKCGGRFDCAMVLASRLAPAKDINDYSPHRTIQNLFEIVVGKKTSGQLSKPNNAEEANGMRQQWREFLSENKAKLDSGYQFTIAELPEGLGIRASSGAAVTAE